MGGLCGSREVLGRFGEVKWGLSQQLWGAMAYLGQGALRHKQLGLPSLVYASRRPPAI